MVVKGSGRRMGGISIAIGLVSPHQHRRMLSRSMSSHPALLQASDQVKPTATPFDFAWRHRVGSPLSGLTTSVPRRVRSRPHSSLAVQCCALLSPIDTMLVLSTISKYALST